MSEAEGSGIYDAEYSDSDSDDESETGLSEESDSGSSDDEDDDEFVTEESQIVEVQEASGISSDEGGEKESCPICLNRFIGQDLGIPESCDHIFCLECIKEWSKNINTCPIDRTEFNYVNLKSTPNGKILKKIKVKVRPKEPENALQQESTLCEVCHLGDREDRLLLCDACDLAYHCECLDPPLFRVPIEEWFCPPCSGILQNGAVAGSSVPRSRRVIPRTRASENVRTRVQDRRTRPTITRSPSNARKRAPQKRKRRAYRRSYKKVVTLARTKKNLMDGSKGKECPRSTAVIVTYRRRRRRRKKRRVTTKSVSAKKSSSRSVNKRISKHLGLVESSQGGSIPDVKPTAKSTSKSIVRNRTSHFLFGDKNQLMDFSESFNEDTPGPSRRQQETVTPQPSSSPINILDSIIAGQKILHTKSNDVIIKKDGSLVLKENEAHCRQQEAVTPQPSSSPISFLDSIIAGQKILHTKSNDVIIKKDGSLVLKENKAKEKGIFKKLLGSDKTKEKEMVKKRNTFEKSNEKDKGAIKKSSFYNKTREQSKGIVKNPDTSKAVKSSKMTFGEPSMHEAIPKAEKLSERKPSPMLLAALARRRENETSNQSVSDHKRKSTSSVERIATSADSYQHSSLLNEYGRNLNVKPNIDRQNSLKQSLSSLKFEKNINSSSFEALNKPNYSHEASLKKLARAGPNKSYFDSFQNSGLSNSSSNNLMFACFEPNTSKVKYEKNNKRSCFKSENAKESPNHSSFSPKQEFNNASRFHDVTQSTLLENSRSARHSCIKNENISSNGRVKKTEIQKYIKKEEINDFPSEKATVANSSTNATMLISTENEMNSDNEDTMELIPSQSLIQGNSDVLLTSFSDAKQPNLVIKKEPYSYSEKLDSKYSQSLAEPLREQCRSNSQSPHKSLNNQVNDLKLKIKKELESFDDYFKSPNVESSRSFNKFHRQTLDAIMDDDDDTVGFEDSPSIITQTVTETTVKTGQTYRKRIEDEINDSDDETNIHNVSKFYSQSKVTGNLRNNKNVSENFSKIKIKEELHSSEDEGGESCSLLSHDLSFTQLAEKNNLSYPHLKNPTTNCIQTINSPLNEQVNDLPCTQLAETICDKKDKLPFTNSSKSLFNKRNKDLPCTQLIETLDEQMDDLPCTQLMEPYSVESFSNEKEDALPCTQLARPLSKVKLDSLQCIQLAVPAPIRYMKEEDDLPATRPTTPFSHMEIDDLPCTQLSRPLSSLQMDDLPATQFVLPAPRKCSKGKVDSLPVTQPTSSLSQIQTDDLPCTQLVESSLRNSESNEEDTLPSTQLMEPLPNNSIFDEDDALPCTQSAKPISSLEMEDLPCTQLARPPSSMPIDDFPSTQFVVPLPVKNPSEKKVDALPATQPYSPLSQIQNDDLPCTQLAKPLPNNSICDEEDDALPCTQLAEPVSSMGMEDLPCTQQARPLSSTNTQFVVPLPVKNPFKKKVDALPATQPSSPLSQIQNDDLPCTQLAKPSSKNSIFDEEEDALPCTQLARPVSRMGMDDLPCTQQARALSSTSTQFVVPLPVKTSSKKKVDALPATQPSSQISQIQMDDLPCTQLVETSSLGDKEENSLPCTQLATPVSNLHSGKSRNYDHNPNAHVQSRELPGCSGKLGYNADVQTKQQQSDNFQEAKNSHENLLATQPNTSMEHSSKNSENLSNLNSDFDDDFDLPETQPLFLDQNNSKSKKLLQENSCDEQVTDEELLSNIDMLKIKRPPAQRKVVGVHKNLPQVLMPIPSRRIPVPKPSNRKTFSFDQVKQQYDAKCSKNMLQQNISHGKMFAVTKIGDLTTKQTLSSVLKEEHQVSSECKAEILNNLKNKKSLLVDEPEILVSSIPNCDLKVKIDKSCVPEDSEIEIINDDEIMRTKNVEEVMLSSDEEDLPATQFIDRTTNQCSSLPNKKKLESFHIPIKREHNSNILSVNNGNAFKKVVVKKENTLDDFKVENVNTFNPLSVKQEKCEENTLREIKMEPWQQSKAEEKISRLVKSVNKSHATKDITAVRNIKCVDKCTDQKTSNTKIINNNASTCVRSHEKHVREHKGKTDSTDHSKKFAKDGPSSSDVKWKFEKEKKSKTEGSSEKRIPSKDENKGETKTCNASPSKSNSNSNIKLSTENVNKIKLVSNDKKPKIEHVSSSHTHAKADHIKNHKINSEKRKYSSKEDNYQEENKRQKHISLDDSKKVQDHKKLKVDSFTLKTEPTDKNGKHGFEKSFDCKKEAYKLQNNVKIEDSTRQKTSKRCIKDKMSNSKKVQETHESNDGKNRNDKKAKVHIKTAETTNSSKLSSEMNSKVAHSSSHDNERNCKYVNSDNKTKELINIPFNDKERLNGRIKVEPDSEKKVNNRLKESKTNFKDESTRAGSVVKRSDSSEGERITKRSRLESLSCSEDNSDCHSDYSRSSVISPESHFKRKSKHRMNALNALDEIADEIIGASKNCKTDILNQDENIDLEVIKRSKDPSPIGRKVDKANLKDEIAAEVKIALKPFYTVGLIDKEDYKDIMRKAVPKIYMNCGNYVHPEKIKNLVTSYVKKLTSS